MANKRATTATVDTDNKFVRFLIGSFTNDGTQVWWIVFILGALALVAVIFSFFGALVDANFVIDPVNADDNRTAAVFEQVRQDFGMNTEELVKFAQYWRSRRELGRPFTGEQRQ